MAQGIDTPVHHVQAAISDPTVDPAGAKTDRQQLPTVDHRLLALRDRHYLPVGGFAPNSGVDPPIVAHSPSLPSENVRVTRAS